MLVLGTALNRVEPNFALSVLEEYVSTVKRVWPRPGTRETTRILGAQTNMVTCYTSTGRNEEALQLEIKLHRDWVNLYGPTDERTMLVRNNLIQTLMDNKHFEMAKEFAEAQYEVAQQVLGDRNHKSLSACGRYCEVLYLNPARTRADLLRAQQILARDLTPRCQRALGPTHPTTMGVADLLK